MNTGKLLLAGVAAFVVLVVQYVIAALIAGFIYKEDAAPAARRASA